MYQHVSRKLSSAEEERSSETLVVKADGSQKGNAENGLLREHKRSGGVPRYAGSVSESLLSSS